MTLNKRSEAATTATATTAAATTTAMKQIHCATKLELDSNFFPMAS